MDQAEQLRRIIQQNKYAVIKDSPPNRHAKTVAVISGKGGVWQIEFRFKFRFKLDQKTKRPCTAGRLRYWDGKHRSFAWTEVSRKINCRFAEKPHWN